LFSKYAFNIAEYSQGMFLILDPGYENIWPTLDLANTLPCVLL